MTNLTSMEGQLYFSKAELNATGDAVARITDLSLFSVSSIDVGRWSRLDHETDTRKVVVTYRDGRKAEMNLFRDRS